MKLLGKWNLILAERLIKQLEENNRKRTRLIEELQYWLQKKKEKQMEQEVTEPYQHQGEWD